jgi:hypothetical protein
MNLYPTKTPWQNSPSIASPVNSLNLNKIENGLYNIAQAVDHIETDLPEMISDSIETAEDMIIDDLTAKANAVGNVFQDMLNGKNILSDTNGKYYKETMIDGKMYLEEVPPDPTPPVTSKIMEFVEYNNYSKFFHENYSDFKNINIKSGDYLIYSETMANAPHSGLVSGLVNVVNNGFSNIWITYKPWGSNDEYYLHYTGAAWVGWINNLTTAGGIIAGNVIINKEVPDLQLKQSDWHRAAIYKNASSTHDFGTRIEDLTENVASLMVLINGRLEVHKYVNGVLAGYVVLADIGNPVQTTGMVRFSEEQNGVIVSTMIPVASCNLKNIEITNVTVWNVQDYPQYISKFIVTQRGDGFYLHAYEADVKAAFTGKTAEVHFTVS